MNQKTLSFCFFNLRPLKVCEFPTPKGINACHFTQQCRQKEVFADMGKGCEMGLETLVCPRITCLPEAPCLIGSREDWGPRPFLYKFESSVVIIMFSLQDHVPAQNLPFLFCWYFLCVHILIQEEPTMLFPASPERPETLPETGCQELRKEKAHGTGWEKMLIFIFPPSSLETLECSFGEFCCCCYLFYFSNFVLVLSAV